MSWIKELIASIRDKYSLTAAILIFALYCSVHIYKKTKKTSYAVLTSLGVIIVSLVVFFSISFFDNFEKNFNALKSFIQNEITQKGEKKTVDELVAASTYLDLTTLKLPEKDKKDINNVLDAISNAKTIEQVELAEKMRQQLRGDSLLMQSIKLHLKAGIKLSKKDYKGALQAICKRYNNYPKTSFYNRLEFAWTTSQIINQIGIKKTEQLITELKDQYSHPDLSYAWLVLTPQDIENLYDNKLSYISISRNKESFARYLLQNYPNDPHRDHILFSLHEYGKILEEYPASPIAEKAYYITYSNRLKQFRRLAATEQYDDELLLIAKKLCNPSIEFRDLFLKGQALNLCSTALANVTSIKESTSAFLTYFSVLPNENRKDFFYGYYHNLTPNNALFLTKLTNTNDYKVKLTNEDYEKQAIRAFEQRDYNCSLAFYLRLPTELQEETPHRSNRIAALKKIKQLTESDAPSKRKLFLTALALKQSNYDSYHAIQLFKKFLKCCPEKEKAKTLMLLAFCYRNEFGEGKKMKACYQQIIEKYPKHPLADDAMAEIGVYHLLWTYDSKRYDLARSWFQRVIDTYPTRNAVDNCYNWIAWSYLEEEKYINAIKAYKKLIEKVPTSRFVDYAIKNLKKLSQ